MSSTTRNMMGGKNPKRVVGTNPVLGLFCAIEADGAGKMTIQTLDVNGESTNEWNGLVLASGQSLVFGSKRVTRIVLTSGSGFVYEV